MTHLLSSSHYHRIINVTTVVIATIGIAIVDTSDTITTAAKKTTVIHTAKIDYAETPIIDIATDVRVPCFDSCVCPFNSVLEGGGGSNFLRTCLPLEQPVSLER